MDEIEQLLAAEEIKKLKARRDRALDTKDWPLYASLHLPGCRIDDGSGIRRCLPQLMQAGLGSSI